MTTQSEQTTTTTRATHHADSADGHVASAKAQIAWLLERRDAREWAISSKGLADAVGLKATTVRDCIKELRRERQLPIVACPNGYYLVTDDDTLQRELDRIADEIETRKQTMAELETAYQTMTTDTDTTQSIAATIHEVLQNRDGTVPREDLIKVVAVVAEADADAVGNKLDDLEANGFVYIADGVVKLP
jgi:biotin operon repressor